MKVVVRFTIKASPSKTIKLEGESDFRPEINQRFSVRTPVAHLDFGTVLNIEYHGDLILIQTVIAVAEVSIEDDVRFSKTSKPYLRLVKD